MGVDYIPSMSVSRYEYGLDAGSMGFGMTYETSLVRHLLTFIHLAQVPMI
ncbi:hypothetical protein N9C31_03590 [Gammaproteobacteria bacterium]|nr:hypothetical protein [Gammaproteobacteria bacterium]